MDRKIISTVLYNGRHYITPYISKCPNMLQALPLLWISFTAKDKTEVNEDIECSQKLQSLC